MMVGREVSLVVEKVPAHPGEPVLVVDDLHVLSDQDALAVQGVSFEVRAGEILGIAGVQGNGQTELVEAITGLRESIAGQVTILGNDVTNASPREITELGVGHIPEDRTHDGLVLSYPIVNNLVLNTYYKAPFARGISLNEEEMVKYASELVRQFDVRTPSIWVEAANLSGGNQQKVIVAREFSRPISLLVAAQPTRGLDVGSIEYIHRRILEKRDAGCAVLLVSSELDEIMALSDRIAVMYRGRIIDTVLAQEATREYIGLLMAGIKPEKREKLPGPAEAKVQIVT
jgi:simple sugar transport system ATP-binding protein